MVMVTDEKQMDSSNNELPTNDNVKLMGYQKSSGSKDQELIPPMATMEEDSPPTPPPPLPPLPLSVSPPPRPSETHPLTGGHDDQPSENTTLNKSHDEYLLVKDSSRPKRVRGTTHLVSSLYAKLLVAATAVLVTTEVLPNNVPLFFYHGYVFTFLLGGAILCILFIYMSLCLQRCPGVEELEELDEESAELSKKVVKSSKWSTPEISIFFRVGALVFGLGTLIAIGLETATLFTGREKPCVDKLNFVQPILHALFTIMQMHFLSLNSQRAIQNLGWCRHLILMHLVATNLAVWLRLVVWETAKSWLNVTHASANSTERWPPTGYNTTVHSLFSDGRHAVFVSSSCYWIENEEEKMEDLLVLQQCYLNNTIGLIWEKAQPFIVPFIVQYCLVGAVVNYVLWECFSNRRRRITRRSTSWSPRRQDLEATDLSEDKKVDCKGSSKGLFLGLLVLAVGIVVLILFFVLSNNQNLKEETLFIMITVHCSILALSALGIVFGICRVGGMCTDYGRQHHLHTVLQNIGVAAVFVHGFCSLVVGATDIGNSRYLAVFVDGALMIFQSLMQSVFFHKIGQKCCTSKCQHEESRPGRQIVTFLAFTNLVLWMTESFTDHNHVTSQLQLQFFGVIPWGLVGRLLLPLVIFYRFHSSVYLMEVWKSGYSVDR